MIAAIRERFTAEKSTADEGFGMAELAVYAVLSLVVLTIVASLFNAALDTRTQVTDLTQAAGVGQLIATSVEEGVRNANGPLGATDNIQKRGIKVDLTTATGQLLRARVAVGAQDGSIVWRCQAWFFSPVTGSVYSTTSDTLIADPVGFTQTGGVHTPTAGTNSWTVIGSGVQTDSKHPIFFGENNSGVVLYFNVVTTGEPLLLIPTTVVPRSLAAGGTGPDQCY